jgi:hypothetical protein
MIDPATTTIKTLLDLNNHGSIVGTETALVFPVDNGSTPPAKVTLNSVKSWITSGVIAPNIIVVKPFDGALADGDAWFWTVPVGISILNVYVETSDSNANAVSVDIFKGVTSIYGTNKLSIDVNEKSSYTAATPPTNPNSPAPLASVTAGDVLEFRVVTAGSRNGLTVTIVYG